MINGHTQGEIRTRRFSGVAEIVATTCSDELLLSVFLTYGNRRNRLIVTVRSILSSIVTKLREMAVNRRVVGSSPT